MEQKPVLKLHRVGTITFGCLLILFGVLFLVQMFVPALNYEIIFRMWPCIFVLLGLEVLVSNRRAMMESKEQGNEVKFVYDTAAILLIICLTFFAMIMAVADYAMRYEYHIHI